MRTRSDVPCRRNRHIALTTFVRTLRGVCHPFLALGNDGVVYVVKLRTGSEDEHRLFNEAMGTELYRALGLMVPAWRPLVVTDDFIDGNPGAWPHVDGVPVRPQAGLAFGAHFLGQDGAQVMEILPKSYYKRILNPSDFWLAWLIDICAAHADARQAVFTQRVDGWLTLHFVDHSHMFGGPGGAEKVRPAACRYLDPAAYRDVSKLTPRSLRIKLRDFNSEQMWSRVKLLPSSWRTPTAITTFASCLGKLANGQFLDRTLEEMEAHLNHETYTFRIPERPGEAGLLFSGI